MPRIRTYKASGSKKKRKTPKVKYSNTFTFGAFLFKTIVIVFAVALFLAYVSVYIKSSDLSFLMFFGLYYIPIFFVNLLLFFVAFIKLKKIAFLPLIALLPAMFYADLFFRLRKEEPLPDGSPIKVMTYNVGRFTSAKDGLGVEMNLARIEEFVKEERPDVLCLQEFAVIDSTKLDMLFEDLPHSHHLLFNSIRNDYGNVIFSKYPLVDSGVHTFAESRNLCVWADINVDGQLIRVINCHFQSTGVSRFIQKYTKHSDFSSEVKEVHEQLLQSNRRRSAQVDEVLENCSNCDHPVLICGDFNDTPISRTYHKLSQGRKDSFAEAGQGFSASYSILWPLLRIDYILFPMEYEASDNVTHKVNYSDHYPVSAIIYK